MAAEGKSSYDFYVKFGSNADTFLTDLQNARQAINREITQLREDVATGTKGLSLPTVLQRTGGRDVEDGARGGGGGGGRSDLRFDPDVFNNAIGVFQDGLADIIHSIRSAITGIDRIPHDARRAIAEENRRLGAEVRRDTSPPPRAPGGSSDGGRYAAGPARPVAPYDLREAIRRAAERTAGTPSIASVPAGVVADAHVMAKMLSAQTAQTKATQEFHRDFRVVANEIASGIEALANRPIVVSLTGTAGQGQPVQAAQAAATATTTATGRPSRPLNLTPEQQVEEVSRLNKLRSQVEQRKRLAALEQAVVNDYKGSLRDMAGGSGTLIAKGLRTGMEGNAWKKAVDNAIKGLRQALNDVPEMESLQAQVAAAVERVEMGVDPEIVKAARKGPLQAARPDDEFTKVSQIRRKIAERKRLEALQGELGRAQQNLTRTSFTKIAPQPEALKAASYGSRAFRTVGEASKYEGKEYIDYLKKAISSQESKFEGDDRDVQALERDLAEAVAATGTATGQRPRGTMQGRRTSRRRERRKQKRNRQFEHARLQKERAEETWVDRNRKTQAEITELGAAIDSAQQSLGLLAVALGGLEAARDAGRSDITEQTLQPYRDQIKLLEANIETLKRELVGKQRSMTRGKTRRESQEIRRRHGIVPEPTKRLAREDAANDLAMMRWSGTSVLFDRETTNAELQKWVAAFRRQGYFPGYEDEDGELRDVTSKTRRAELQQALQRAFQQFQTRGEWTADDLKSYRPTEPDRVPRAVQQMVQPILDQTMADLVGRPGWGTSWGRDAVGESTETAVDPYRQALSYINRWKKNQNLRFDPGTLRRRDTGEIIPAEQRALFEGAPGFDRDFEDIGGKPYSARDPYGQQRYGEALEIIRQTEERRRSIAAQRAREMALKAPATFNPYGSFSEGPDGEEHFRSVFEGITGSGEEPARVRAGVHSLLEATDTFDEMIRPARKAYGTLEAVEETWQKYYSLRDEISKKEASGKPVNEGLLTAFERTQERLAQLTEPRMVEKVGLRGEQIFERLPSVEDEAREKIARFEEQMGFQPGQLSPDAMRGFDLRERARMEEKARQEDQARERRDRKTKEEDISGAAQSLFAPYTRLGAGRGDKGTSRVALDVLRTDPLRFKERFPDLDERGYEDLRTSQASFIAARKKELRLRDQLANPKEGADLEQIATDVRVAEQAAERRLVQMVETYARLLGPGTVPHRKFSEWEEVPGYDKDLGYGQEVERVALGAGINLSAVEKAEADLNDRMQTESRARERERLDPRTAGRYLTDPKTYIDEGLEAFKRRVRETEVSQHGYTRGYERLPIQLTDTEAIRQGLGELQKEALPQGRFAARVDGDEKWISAEEARTRYDEAYASRERVAREAVQAERDLAEVAQVRERLEREYQRVLTERIAHERALLRPVQRPAATGDPVRDAALAAEADRVDKVQAMRAQRDAMAAAQQSGPGVALAEARAAEEELLQRVGGLRGQATAQDLYFESARRTAAQAGIGVPIRPSDDYPMPDGSEGRRLETPDEFYRRLAQFGRNNVSLIAGLERVAQRLNPAGVTRAHRESLAAQKELSGLKDLIGIAEKSGSPEYENLIGLLPGAQRQADVAQGRYIQALSRMEGGDLGQVTAGEASDDIARARELLARAGVQWSETLNESLHTARTVDELFERLQALISAGTLMMTPYKVLHEGREAFGADNYSLGDKSPSGLFDRRVPLPDQRRREVLAQMRREMEELEEEQRRDQDILGSYDVRRAQPGAPPPTKAERESLKELQDTMEARAGYMRTLAGDMTWMEEVATRTTTSQAPLQGGVNLRDIGVEARDPTEPHKPVGTYAEVFGREAGEQAAVAMEAQTAAKARAVGNEGLADDCCARIIAAINEVNSTLRGTLKVSGNITRTTRTVGEGAETDANVGSGFSRKALRRNTIIDRATAERLFSTYRVPAELQEEVFNAKTKEERVAAGQRLVQSTPIRQGEAVKIFAGQMAAQMEDADESTQKNVESVQDLQQALRQAVAQAEALERAEGLAAGKAESLVGALDARNAAAAAKSVAAALDLGGDKAHELSRELSALQAKYNDLRSKGAKKDVLDPLQAQIAQKSQDLYGQLWGPLRRARPDEKVGVTRARIGEVMSHSLGGPVNMSAVVKSGKAVERAYEESITAAARGRSMLNPVTEQLFGPAGFMGRSLHTMGTFVVRNFAAGMVFGLQNALADAFMQAIETESTFVRVSDALESTGRSSAGLRTELQGISQEYGVALRDVYTTAAGLTGLFQDNSLLTQTTRVAVQLQMISGGALNATEAMRTLSGVTSAFADVTPEHIADVATVIQNRLSVNIEDTIEGVSRISGQAVEMGLSFEEAGTYVAAIAKFTGQTGMAAGEQFSRILAALQTGRGQSAVISGLGSVGVDVSGALANRDYSSTVRELMENYSRLSDAEKARITVGLGGQRQAAAINGLLKEGAGILQTVTAAQNANGEASRRAARIADEFTGQINKARQAFVNFIAGLARSGLFDPLLVALKSINFLLGNLNDLISGLNDIADSNAFLGFTKGLVTNFLGAAAAVLILRKGVQALFGALGMAKSGAMGGAAGAMGGGMATRFIAGRMGGEAAEAAAQARANRALGRAVLADSVVNAFGGRQRRREERLAAGAGNFYARRQANLANLAASTTNFGDRIAAQNARRFSAAGISGAAMRGTGSIASGAAGLMGLAAGAPMLATAAIGGLIVGLEGLWSEFRRGQQATADLREAFQTTFGDRTRKEDAGVPEAKSPFDQWLEKNRKTSGEDGFSYRGMWRDFKGALGGAGPLARKMGMDYRLFGESEDEQRGVLDGATAERLQARIERELTHAGDGLTSVDQINSQLAYGLEGLASYAEIINNSDMSDAQKANALDQLQEAQERLRKASQDNLLIAQGQDRINNLTGDQIEAMSGLINSITNFSPMILDRYSDFLQMAVAAQNYMDGSDAQRIMDQLVGGPSLEMQRQFGAGENLDWFEGLTRGLEGVGGRALRPGEGEEFSRQAAEQRAWLDAYGKGQIVTAAGISGGQQLTPFPNAPTNKGWSSLLTAPTEGLQTPDDMTEVEREKLAQQIARSRVPIEGNVQRRREMASQAAKSAADAATARSMTYGTSMSEDAVKAREQAFAALQQYDQALNNELEGAVNDAQAYMNLAAGRGNVDAARAAMSSAIRTLERRRDQHKGDAVAQAQYDQRIQDLRLQMTEAHIAEINRPLELAAASTMNEDAQAGLRMQMLQNRLNALQSYDPVISEEATEAALLETPGGQGQSHQAEYVDGLQSGTDAAHQAGVTSGEAAAQGFAQGARSALANDPLLGPLLEGLPGTTTTTTTRRRSGDDNRPSLGTDVATLPSTQFNADVPAPIVAPPPGTNTTSPTIRKTVIRVVGEDRNGRQIKRAVTIEVPNPNYIPPSTAAPATAAPATLPPGRASGATDEMITQTQTNIAQERIATRQRAEERRRAQQQLELARVAPGDALRQAQMQAAHARANQRAAASMQGRNSAAYIQATQEAVQAQWAIIAAQGAIAQANSNLAVAMAQATGNAVAIADAQVAAANTALGVALRNSGGARTAEVINAEAQVVSAMAAQRDAVWSLFNAHTNLAVAIAEAAGHTVEAAQHRQRLANDQLNQALARSGGAESEEVVNARAAATTAAAAARDAQLAEDLAWVDHEMTMRRMSTADAIRFYENILATRELTIAQRRQVESTLMGLKNQGDGQWNIGDIRMPTPYQMRRQLLGGYDDAQTMVLDAITAARGDAIGASGGSISTVTTNNQTSIYINGADLGAVRQILDQYFGQQATQRTSTSTRKIG